MNKQPSEIFETPEASGFDRVINKQPERSVDEIYKRVRSNGRAILYSDLIGLGVENERKQCGRDDMWAITTEELEELTQTLQAERQKREEMVALEREYVNAYTTFVNEMSVDTPFELAFESLNDRLSKIIDTPLTYEPKTSN